jgi:hypothetical protein
MSTLRSTSLEGFAKAAETVLINPLIPQFGGLFKAGGTPPDPQQEVSCTSFSAVSLRK